MLKENHALLSGNDKYEGYCIDLLKEIALVLGFRFHIKQVDDSKYGEKNEQGEWNGMIKELIDGVQLEFIFKYHSYSQCRTDGRVFK